MSISIRDIWQAWPRATAVRVVDAFLEVVLQDGRELRVPLASFEFLEGRSHAEQADVTLMSDGEAIEWERIDESLSVPGLLGLPEIPPADPRVRTYTIDYRRDDGGWLANVRGTDLGTYGDTLLGAKRNARRLVRDYVGLTDLAAAGIEIVDAIQTERPAVIR